MCNRQLRDTVFLHIIMVRVDTDAILFKSMSDTLQPTQKRKANNIRWQFLHSVLKKIMLRKATQSHYIFFPFGCESGMIMNGNLESFKEKEQYE